MLFGVCYVFVTNQANTVKKYNVLIESQYHTTLDGMCTYSWVNIVYTNLQYRPTWYLGVTHILLDYDIITEYYSDIPSITEFV